MSDIAERTYRRTFYLQYKNQSNHSKNQVIHKPHEAFIGQWLLQAIRLAIKKNYNKKIIKNILFLEMFFYNMF